MQTGRSEVRGGAMRRILGVGCGGDCVVLLCPPCLADSSVALIEHINVALFWFIYKYLVREVHNVKD